MGFEVFWDQKVPRGTNWDTWIRAELTKSKCAVVFWSAASAASDNVSHEATVAKRQGKLISVFLEPLMEVDIPLGLYAQQAANLSEWSDDRSDGEWCKFREAVEAKLTPRWVQEKVGSLDAELEGERARRESAEGHEKTLRAQISKEAKIQQDLKRERDQALAAVEDLKTELQGQIAKQVESEQNWKEEHHKTLAGVAKLKATAEDLARQRSDAELQSVELSQRLSELETWHSEAVNERDRALAEVAEFKTTNEVLTRGVTNAEARPTNELAKRWRISIAVGMTLVATAVGSLLVSRSGTTDEAEVKAVQAAALAKSEQARQAAEAKAADADKARQAAEAQAADVERARQAAASKTDDAEKGRQAALKVADYNDKARQAAEAKATDAEKARQTAEAKVTDAEKARQAAAAKADQATAALSASEKARQAAEAKAADVEKARQVVATKADDADKAVGRIKRRVDALVVEEAVFAARAANVGLVRPNDIPLVVDAVGDCVNTAGGIDCRVAIGRHFHLPILFKRL